MSRRQQGDPHAVEQGWNVQVLVAPGQESMQGRGWLELWDSRSLGGWGWRVSKHEGIWVGSG